MPDNNLKLLKVPPVPRGVKATWPVIGTRAPAEDQELVDRAAEQLGVDRAELVYDAVIRRAREVLGIAA